MATILSSLSERLARLLYERMGYPLSSTAPSNLSENVENKWGGVLGGGIDLAINENMALGFDVSYLYLRTNVLRTLNGPISTTTSTSVNLDSVRVLAGIRIKFVSPGWSNIY